MGIKARVFMAVVAGLVVLAGCAGNVSFRKGEKYAIEGDWDRAVTEYRQALQQDPENVGYRARLSKAQDNAFTTHSARARTYMDQKNPDAALYELQEALQFSPGSDKTRQLMAEAVTFLPKSSTSTVSSFIPVRSDCASTGISMLNCPRSRSLRPALLSLYSTRQSMNVACQAPF